MPQPSPLSTFGRRLGASLARLLPEARKASVTGPLIAFDTLHRPVWSTRDTGALAREGFMQNPIVYRCVRMVAECTGAVPFLLYDGPHEIETHPLLRLIERPNPSQTRADLIEAIVGNLLVTGNAYVEAVGLAPDAQWASEGASMNPPDASVAERGFATTWASEGAGANPPDAQRASAGAQVRELYALRPDRIKLVPGIDGWPEAFDYTVSGRTVRISGEAAPGIPRILHLKLYHPADDHYGLSPLEAAAAAIDLHNTAAAWNKALLDNSARPSGALVYTARDGNMTAEQYERLKSELEQGFQGSANAGRPLLLEGGLDWKSMSLSPKDMDFIEARHTAAREIALALGVPPMLLGIPGDNTYSNMGEAQRIFWRQAVLPLAERIAKALTHWLAQPAAETLHVEIDVDSLPALAPEREALWASLEKTSFLTDDEKRAAIGYGPKAEATATKYAGQPRLPAGQPTGGQYTFGDDHTPLHQVQAGRRRLLQGRDRQGRLTDLTNQAQRAVDRVRELDPRWEPPQSAFSRDTDNIEARIQHQEAVRQAAEAASPNSPATPSPAPIPPGASTA